MATSGPISPVSEADYTEIRQNEVNDGLNREPSTSSAASIMEQQKSLTSYQPSSPPASPGLDPRPSRNRAKVASSSSSRKLENQEEAPKETLTELSEEDQDLPADDLMGNSSPPPSASASASASASPSPPKNEGKKASSKQKSKSSNAKKEGQASAASIVNHNFNIFVGKHQVSVVVLKHQGVGGRHPKEHGKFYYQARVRNEYPQKHIWSGWASKEEVVEKVTTILHAKPSTKVELTPTQNPARKVPKEPTDLPQIPLNTSSPTPSSSKTSKAAGKASSSSSSNSRSQTHSPSPATATSSQKRKAPVTEVSNEPSLATTTSSSSSSSPNHRRRTRQENARSTSGQQKSKKAKYDSDFEAEAPLSSSRSRSSSSSSKFNPNHYSDASYEEEKEEEEEEEEEEEHEEAEEEYPQEETAALHHAIHSPSVSSPESSPTPHHPAITAFPPFPLSSGSTRVRVPLPFPPSRSNVIFPVFPKTKSHQMSTLLMLAGIEREQLAKSSGSASEGDDSNSEN